MARTAIGGSAWIGWVIASALAIAFAQAAQGQVTTSAPTTAPLSSAKPDSSADRRYLSLRATADVARYRLSASVDRFLAGAEAPSRNILARAIAANAFDRRAWPRIVAGAVQVRHQSGDEGETLWFNPLFDAGLAVRWRRAEGGWTVTDAWAVLGRNLRGGGDARKPPLLIGAVDRSTVSDQFMLAASELPRLAASGWPAPAGSLEANDEAAARVRAADAAIVAVRATPGYAHAVVAAYDLLSFGEAGASEIRPSLKKVIASIPTDAKTTLRAVSAFRIGGDWTLVMQSPDAPGIAWMASFQSVADAPARIASVSVSYYAQAEATR